jgi:acetoin utilization deacetylase AcuC-like enzyme
MEDAPHLPPPVAIVDDVRFDAHCHIAGHHPESPERLVAARDGLRTGLGDQPRHMLRAREATDQELARVHSPRYVEHLRAALARGAGQLDPDTYISPGSREAAWHAAGSVLDLTDALLSGTSRRGVALLRPPGHHAIRDASMGFCLLNNIALAASSALARGLTRVAIVDWDVHHGNGTQEMFYDDARVLFISMHQYPFYPGTGAAHDIGRGAGAGFTANLALPGESGPELYGASFREVVLPLLRAFAPELVLVSAGFDAHERDPLASMNLDHECYGAFASALLDVVDELGHGRIAFVLEGGYDLYALSDSMRQVSAAITGTRLPLPEGKLKARERAAIDATRCALSAHWPISAAL